MDVPTLREAIVALGSALITAFATVMANGHLNRANAKKAEVEAEAIKARLVSEARAADVKHTVDIEIAINDRIEILLRGFTAQIQADEARIRALSEQVTHLFAEVTTLRMQLAEATHALEVMRARQTQLAAGVPLSGGDAV